MEQTNLSKKLLEMAKAAKSAEDLPALAKESDMKDFTQENSETYKSGEPIEDADLDEVTGGETAYRLNCVGLCRQCNHWLSLCTIYYKSRGEAFAITCPNCGNIVPGSEFLDGPYSLQPWTGIDFLRRAGYPVKGNTLVLVQPN